jgi:hypothetical protein
MMEKPKDLDEAGNSENAESEKSEEYVRFENAARKIMRLGAKESERIRKSPVPKDPEAGKTGK